MRKGFTLIETLVVATIVTVIAVASLAGFSAFRNKQALKGGLDEIRAAVEATKRRSVAQDQGSRWGVRFTNATSGVSSYSTFKGSSYSTSGVDRLYSFRGALGFGNPSASSTYDVVFSPLSGALSENKVLTIVSGRAGLIGDLILRTIGSITARTDADVVGYWHFDEGTSTTTYDASGNANTGTLTNGPTWQSGANCKAGACVSFDGTSKYIVASGVSNLTSAFTIEAWAKTSIVQDATYDAIVSKFSSTPYNGWFLRRNSNSSVVNFSLYNNGSATAAISGPTIVADTWTHYAGTFDGTNAKFYVNGVSVGNDTSASVGSATTNFAIGGNYGGSTENWNGSVDEVHIWNRTLTADEILAHYNYLKKERC